MGLRAPTLYGALRWGAGGHTTGAKPALPPFGGQDAVPGRTCHAIIVTHMGTVAPTACTSMRGSCSHWVRVPDHGAQPPPAVLCDARRQRLVGSGKRWEQASHVPSSSEHVVINCCFHHCAPHSHAGAMSVQHPVKRRSASKRGDALSLTLAQWCATRGETQILLSAMWTHIRVWTLPVGGHKSTHFSFKPCGLSLRACGDQLRHSPRGASSWCTSPPLSRHTACPESVVHIDKCNGRSACHSGLWGRP